MDREKSPTILLIGGTSHVGKSTLAKALANKLGWDYLATDSLGKHPGRPWISAKNPEIKEHVARHYQTLSLEALWTCCPTIKPTLCLKLKLLSTIELPSVT